MVVRTSTGIELPIGPTQSHCPWSRDAPMLRRTVLFLVPLALLLPVHAAGEATDGPGGRFDDDLISRLEGR
jgi:hypothetical protein